MRIIAWPAFRNRHDNPYNALLYTRLTGLGVEVEDFSPRKLLFGRHDVWHLHWPESVLNLPQTWLALPLVYTLVALLKFAKRRGTTIIWTVHNLRSHDRRYPRLESRLWRALVAHLDGYIALTEGGQAGALARFPSLRDRPGFIIPHGHYRAVYPDTVTRAEARARLGLPAEARVLGWLGQIRPYKNVAHLIATFRALPSPDTYLLIAGKPGSQELATEIRVAAQGDPRIRLALGFVPDDEVQVYLRAIDLVVLPYQEILNSGSAILALSFDRPVLVPDRGTMAELQRSVGAAWVRTYDGQLTPTMLRDALAWALATPRDLAALFRELSWEAIAGQTLTAYQTLSARAAPRGKRPRRGDARSRWRWRSRGRTGGPRRQPRRRGVGQP